MSAGPRPHEREQRRQYIEAIGARLREAFGAEVVSVALYGSAARGTDGPYSDIEMICVVRDGDERDITWAHEGWKAEVWLVSRTGFLHEAARLGPEWSLTHGAFVEAVPLYDPDRLCGRGRDLALGHSPEDFDGVMRELIVGHLYERIGKLRTLRNTGDLSAVPLVAAKICEAALCLIGLASRHLYASIATRLTDSLALADRPGGYDALAQLLIAGTLSDANVVTRACETLWSGIEEWAERRHLPIEEHAPTPF